MVNYGFKISPTGVDVKTASDRNLVVTSKYPNPKTYIVGTYNYTFPSDIDSVTIFITHGLGYRPPCFVYFKKPGVSVWGQIPSIDEEDPPDLRYWFVIVSGPDLVILYRETSGNTYDPTGETWRFKYYIMIDKYSL